MIELLVVVAIIGVVAAVAIPAFQTYQHNAKFQTVKASLSNINKGYKSCLVSNDGDQTDCDTLAEINVESQSNTTITAKNKTTTNKQCFDVKITGGFVADKGHQGCIEFDTTDGSVDATTYDTGATVSGYLSGQTVSKTAVCAAAGTCG